MALHFRQVTYGRCDLLIITDVRGDGVIIPKTKFLGRKLVPIMINRNNISEFAASWTGLRKSLFADSKICDFKIWLTDILTAVAKDGTLKCPPEIGGEIEFDELSTITVKQEIPFEAKTFADYFFTDPKHDSSAQYRGEIHTAEKIFPTARGSAWLFRALKANQYGVEVRSFSFE